MLIREVIGSEVDEGLGDLARGTLGAGLLGAALISGTPDAAAADKTHQNYPTELTTAQAGTERIDTFVRVMLPMIQAENNRTLQNRHIVLRFQKKKTLSPSEQTQLDNLFNTYRVSDNDLETLLGRLDIIPPSLVLAQAAVESGWGTSHLAKKANALFGQTSSGAKFAKFGSFRESIASYMENLNSFPSYKGFRQARKVMRDNGRKIRGADLVQHLGNYSERGTSYTNQIRQMILSQKWDRLDDTTYDMADMSVIESRKI